MIIFIIIITIIITCTFPAKRVAARHHLSFAREVGCVIFTLCEVHNRRMRAAVFVVFIAFIVAVYGNTCGVCCACWDGCWVVVVVGDDCCWCVVEWGKQMSVGKSPPPTLLRNNPQLLAHRQSVHLLWSSGVPVTMLCDDVV